MSHWMRTMNNNKITSWKPLKAKKPSLNLKEKELSGMKLTQE
jgi:hypothetical protein